MGLDGLAGDAGFRHQLVARLRQHGSEVRRLTDGLDDTAMEHRIDLGKWSLKELVCHLWRVEQLFEQRIDDMLGRDMPLFESYAPEGDPAFDRLVASNRGGQSVRAFLAHRVEFSERLERLSPDQWQRRGRHPRFETFDIDFLIDYMVQHEAHHLYQMFMRRMPFGKPNLSAAGC